MPMFDIDLRGIEPSVALAPVPDGWYKVRITKSNLKQTAKGDGGYLELIHEIIEGQYQGRNVYWNLNLFNPSQQAVEIAHKQLSAIGHCIGQYRVYDQQVPDNATPMFHNQPYMIWVVVAQGTQGPINNVKGCKDINGNDPGQQARGPAAPMTQPGGPAPAGTWPQPQGGAPAGGMAPGGWSGAAAPATAPQPGAWPQPGGAAPGGPAPGGAPTWQPNQAPAQQPQQQPGGWPAPQQPGGPAPHGAPTGPAPGSWPQPQQPQPGPAPGGAPAWQQGGTPAVAPWGAR